MFYKLETSVSGLLNYIVLRIIVLIFLLFTLSSSVSSFGIFSTKKGSEHSFSNMSSNCRISFFQKKIFHLASPH